MNELQVINEQEVLGKEFRMYGTYEEPLFLAKDIAEWIDYDTSSLNKMLNNVDEDEKLLGTMFRSGQSREVWFLTENGLYEVLMQSRKPIAKSFKTEVKKILKTIRKHGAYMTPQKIEEVLLNPDTIIKLAQNLKEEQEKNKVLTADVERMKPKEIFADAVTVSDSCILVGDLAKLLKQNGVNIGANRLFKWLRENNYLIKRKGSDYNTPTQKSMDLGLFEIKERTINNPDGSVRITRTPKVTGKGQLYFVNKFKEMFVA